MPIKKSRLAKNTLRGLLVLAVCLPFSCNRLSPAGFWNNYRPELMIANKSNQGAWGGHRCIQWTAKDSNTFTSDDARVFAAKHGWEYVDSIAFDSAQTEKWETVNFDSLNQALSANKDIDFLKQIMSDPQFPKFSGAVEMHRFKSGWVQFASDDTNDGTEITGFVFLNREGSKLTVYHVWGD